jgi:serine/threonine protein phosphatase PrpC
MRGTQTMTTKLLTSLLMAAALVSSVAFADDSIRVSMVDGKQQAQFKVGDSRCVLVDDRIQCAPIR